jgi:hypothetical protein
MAACPIILLSNTKPSFGFDSVKKIDAVGLGLFAGMFSSAGRIAARWQPQLRFIGNVNVRKRR